MRHIRSETVTNRLERHHRFLGGGTPLFYDEALHLVRGDGVWLYDDAGRRYLDAYNNVPCVGHGNEVVAEAVARQLRTLNVHSRYLHDGVLDYVERLSALHGAGLSTMVFTCSGTEANEIALMMARAATGGIGIITTEAAYHGNSTEVSKLNSVGLKRVSDETAEPTVRAVPMPARRTSFIDHVGAEIDAFAAGGVPFAGVLMCSLLANEGLPSIPEGAMAGVVDLVHREGGVVIADEVQAGFGRSGNWWGYQTSAFVPDIATMGKPMGGGVPVAGVIAAQEVIERFRSSTGYFNTFAASPLQAAAGMAVLDVIEGDGLVAQVADVGEYLMAALRAMDGPSAMGDVRGHGLFIGIDWLDDGGAPDRGGAHRMVEAMKSRGVLMGNAGPHGNVLKVRPPLVFDRSHADVLLEAFQGALADVVD